MAEENEIEEVVKVKEGDEHCHADPKDHLFVLLLVDHCQLGDLLVGQ